MSKIMDKLRKNSKLKDSDVLSRSKFYSGDASNVCPLEIPMLNVAFTGRPDGGLSPGILMIAGDSKHFKTGFMLECAKAFQNKHGDNGVILFYDSEKGAPIKYFEIRGIDMENIFHSPIKNIEEMKFDMVSQLKMLTDDGIPVMVMVDSIGMLPSIREVNNADNENSAADMTRAKELASFFRIVTPYIAFNDIPFVLINHAYDDMDGRGGKTISGGKKVYLAADDVWIIGRQQDKVGSDIVGYFFVVNIDKSRECKEKSKIFIHSTFDKGINRYSGMFDEAVDCGLIQQSGAWYKLIDFETGEMTVNKRRSAIEKDEQYFENLLKNDKFLEHLKAKYQLG